MTKQDVVLKIYEDIELGKFRILEIDGKTWVVGKDIVLMGCGNVGKSVMNHVNEENRRFEMLEVPDPQNGKLVEMLLINRNNSPFCFAFSGILPNVKLFEKWINSELPELLEKFHNSPQKVSEIPTETAIQVLLNSGEFVKRHGLKIDGDPWIMSVDTAIVLGYKDDVDALKLVL